jgi:lysophospholipase L1-like esterase
MLGTNDSNSMNPAKYQEGMQSLIDRIKASGHTPIIAKIPYNFSTKGYPVAVIQKYNAAIDELNSRNGLMPGPDFFTYFQSHPEMFRDGVHPNREGAAAYCKLWAQAVAPLYRAGGAGVNPATPSPRP